MNPTAWPPAFVPLSSFTPKTNLSRSQPFQHVSTTSTLHRKPTMVAPKHVRRSEEIKRLTKQLEELRAVRDQMKNDTTSDASSPPPPPPPSHQPTETSAPPTITPPTVSKPSSFTLGKHGEGNRFFSITDFSSEDYLPRIIPVAGTVPGLTVAQLEATPPVLCSKPPEPGSLFVTKVPKGFEGELIAMPISANIAPYIDPVVLKVAPNELSASQLPCANEDNVFIILDRGTSDSRFKDNKFYAWDIDGMVKIGWLKVKPAPGEARCLGELILGTLEVRKELRKRKSCWEEENETYT